MDRRERLHSDLQPMLMLMDTLRADLWTAMPGIVQSFDPVAMTCSVQPCILANLQNEKTGKISTVQLPLLLDCPVFFPAGGGYTMTFPIAPGDECLVVFASRCIDAWWQAGGIQAQSLIRMHDLSDGFVFAGVRSQPRVLPAVSTGSVQLRTDDGSAFVEISGTDINAVTPSNISANAGGDVDIDAGGQVTISAGNSITLNAPTIVLNGQVIQGKGNHGGNCQMQGPLNVVEDVTAGNISLQSHVHSGVQSGGSNTGGPL